MELVHEEELEEMENKQSSDHLNAFQSTSASMISLAAGMAVAKKESEEQIKKLTSKIDHLATLVEKLLSKKSENTNNNPNSRRPSICEECKRRHPTGMCWEDEENAAARPHGWKSTKK